ncbi:MAG: kelch repeat-containing protein [Polyangiales bacterium]
MARFLSPAVMLGVVGLLSCGQADTPPEVRASVYSLTGPGIPEDMDCLEISVRSGGEVNSRRLTVNGLMDTDENGRAESIIGSDELPDYGTPFEIRILARTAIDGGCGQVDGTTSYTGSTGSITLSAGERRVLKIALYEVGATEPLERGESLPPRFLHTSTALGDGRVLISGGFDSLESTTCPTEIVADSCYEASASSDAYIFDTPTGEFLPVAGGMLEARGGHTATLMNDGRVFIAGGASTALLAVSDGEQPVFRILPIDGGVLRAHASFEFFSRGLENPSDDPEGLGFPGRGFFEGPAANTAEPGPLNHERFLHAAATTDDLHVVLAGGTGNGAPSTTFEVFDLLRPGGEGVSSESGTLQARREMPSAFVLDDAVWIYGGAEATEDADLAEVWDGGSPVGTTAVATDEGFALSDDPHPELALFRPQVMTNAEGDKALVSGWFGPQCDALADTPELPTYTGLDLFRCTEPAGTIVDGTPGRNFFVSDGAVDVFQPSSNQNQAFASAVRLDNSDSVVVFGGLRRNLETRSAAVGYVFETQAPLGTSCLRSQRALHTSTMVPGNHILTTGGLRKVLGTGALILTAPAAEMMSLTADGDLPSISCL